MSTLAQLILAEEKVRRNLHPHPHLDFPLKKKKQTNSFRPEISNIGKQECVAQIRH